MEVYFLKYLKYFNTCYGLANRFFDFCSIYIVKDLFKLKNNFCDLFLKYILKL